jgi:hypothetical protein
LAGLRVAVRSIPGPEGEAAFQIGAALSIFEAACIYRDKHPWPALLGAIDFDDAADRALAEAFHGLHRDRLRTGAHSESAKSEGASIRFGRDVYFHLIKAVELGKVGGAEVSYIDPLNVSPFRTRVPLATLLALASERGDAGDAVAVLSQERGEAPSKASPRGPRSHAGSMLSVLEALDAEGRTFATHKAAHRTVLERLGKPGVRGLSYKTFCKVRSRHLGTVSPRIAE